MQKPEYIARWQRSVGFFSTIALAQDALAAHPYKSYEGFTDCTVCTGYAFNRMGQFMSRAQIVIALDLPQVSCAPSTGEIMNANTLTVESVVGAIQPQKQAPSAEQLREFERRAREARKQAQLAANKSVRERAMGRTMT